MARPASDISERILHAARTRFLQEGVDGASLRNVAADAKTSIGMVYYYYPTNDDLFLAVVEEVYARMVTDVENALGNEGTTEARILRLYTRVAQMSAEEFDIIRLIVREALVSSDRLARVTERFSRGHFPILVATVMQGMASGELRSDLHPFSLASSLVSLALVPQVALRLIGPSLADRFGGVAPSPTEVAQASTRVVLEGIAASPEKKGTKKSANLQADDKRSALKRLPSDKKRNTGRRKNSQKR